MCSMPVFDICEWEDRRDVGVINICGECGGAYRGARRYGYCEQCENWLWEWGCLEDEEMEDGEDVQRRAGREEAKGMVDEVQGQGEGRASAFSSDVANK